ncbi:MAG: hypothetical protein ABW168_16340 [Sedimenticola sp.]
MKISTSRCLTTRITPPYVQLRNEIKEVLFMLANTSQYPVAARLFLMLHFAQQVSGYFNKKATSDCTGQLIEEINQIADPDTHQGLVKKFYDRIPDYTLSTGTPLAILLFRTDNKNSFGQFCGTIFSQYGLEISCVPESATSKEFNGLIERFIQSRGILEEHYAQRFEMYLERLLIYRTGSDYYITSPSLLEYARNLQVYITIIKFLFILHPETQEVVNQLSEGREDKAQTENLDKAIVHVVYQVSRGFDHWSNRGLELLSRALDDGQLNEFEQIVTLARS